MNDVMSSEKRILTMTFIDNIAKCLPADTKTNISGQSQSFPAPWEKMTSIYYVGPVPFPNTASSFLQSRSAIDIWRLSLLFAPSKIYRFPPLRAIQMVKVCGFVVNEDVIVRYGVAMGYGTDGDMFVRSDTMIDAFLDIVSQAGLAGHARWVGVMVKGKLCRCIALGNNDPFDHLRMPSREKIDRLKTVLHTDREPRWYTYA